MFTDILERVRITNPSQLHQIKDENGDRIDFEVASGQQILDHLRHNMTNYDVLIEEIINEQNHITYEQRQSIQDIADAKIIAFFYPEYRKVIRIAQERGDIIKELMEAAGVGTVSALSTFIKMNKKRKK